ncbi:MFS transporter [Roseateles amylovorans]|uniref:MFS transporter n=1 Tax=Roseateles amylovorans TaxID=2978473 RepID=A0ABY6B0A6_9BURK|nr:MFS transporter [Roseateles amylovorans]UXH78377.1 MFS transporter [Roseateles amylovorans]
MRSLNWLATRNGRVSAFFFLYLAEGLPLGFAVTAVVTQLRRQGAGAAEIGAFVGALLLPWALKWAFGPLIDTFAIKGLGRRRGWILASQVMMALTLIPLMFIDLPTQLSLFSAVLLIHNCFGALQDVAIDALACSTLAQSERGVASGAMLAGATLGQAIGGGGVLFLSGFTGFQPTFLFVAAAILLVTLFIALPMKEAPADAPAALAGSRLSAAVTALHDSAVMSFRSLLSTRGAFAGMLFALLPMGAMCLGLTLQSNLAVEFGLKDDQIGLLQILGTVVSVATCVLGGWLSDRWGRRRAMATFIALTSLPVGWLAWEMQGYGWVMPRPAGTSAAPASLIAAFLVACFFYAAFQGLVLSTRSAIFMDVTDPRTAATQFAAYAALANVATALSATWQGVAIEAWGYPVTMTVDVVAGLLCLLPLAFVSTPRTIDAEVTGDGGAAGRARKLALALGVGCLAWLPAWHASAQLGALLPIANTFFSLVFVCAALFLFAGTPLLGDSTVLRRSRWLGLALLAMELRRFAGSSAGGMQGLAGVPGLALDVYLYAVPLLAAGWLSALTRRPQLTQGRGQRPVSVGADA